MATDTLQVPQVDHHLRLQKDTLVTDGVCTEVSENPVVPDGVLLKVMVREDFAEGELCWLIDSAGARIGATVESVEQHSTDRELTLAAVLPDEARWDGVPQL